MRQRHGNSREASHDAPWVFVSGDFVATGGMDMANLELAKRVAAAAPVHVVAHRIESTLANARNVATTLVPRPFGWHIAGQRALRRVGLKASAKALACGGRAVVNGGNCPAADVNWVHYVHAAYTPQTSAGVLPRIKGAIHRARALRDERHALAVARRVICNSQATARHVTELLNVDARKVAVVYYGADDCRLASISAAERRAMRLQLAWDERPWVLFVGALGDSRKGFDTLYQAWRSLCGQVSWDANLAVVGRGSELASWQRRTIEDRLDKRIAFLGFRDDVPRVLSACDLLVHPSRYEAYGLGVHEAVCRGIPAIVSRGAGVSERLSPAMDELLLPDNATAATIAERLKHWECHLERWPARLRALSEELRGYSWQHMAQDFVRAAAV